MLEPEITADRQTDLTEKAASGTLTLTLVSSLLAAGYLNAMTGLLCVTESLCALLLWSLFPGFIVLNAAPRPSQWGLGVKVKAFSHTHTHTHVSFVQTARARPYTGNDVSPRPRHARRAVRECSCSKLSTNSRYFYLIRTAYFYYYLRGKYSTSYSTTAVVSGSFSRKLTFLDRQNV